MFTNLVLYDHIVNINKGVDFLSFHFFYLENCEGLLNFAKNHTLEDNLVKKAFEHLLDIQRRETIWANQQKIKQKQKGENMYNAIIMAKN